MVKNAGQFGIGIFAWWVVGYAFALGGADNGFLGTQYWAGKDWREALVGSQATVVGLIGISVLYIINGAIAERTQVLPYLLFAFIIMVFAWPVAVSWGWGGGWLSSMDEPFEDMGGVGIVHVYAGTFALVGALLVGKRAGRWTSDAHVPEFKYGNTPLVVIGTLLYFIHLCFLNSVSAPTMIDRGRAVFNTWLCAGSCALTLTLLGTLTNKSVEHHFVTVLRGFIAGAVLISGVGFNVDGWAAFTFGVFGGFFMVASLYLVQMVHLDDVTENVSVHLVMGLVGCFGVGLWDNTRGGFHGRDGMLIGTQLAGECAIAAWSAVFAVAIFGLCKLLGLLTVPESVQMGGFNNSMTSLKGFMAVEMQVVPNREPVDASRGEASRLQDQSVITNSVGV